MTRYVVRPKGILTTPRLLAEKLGARTRSAGQVCWQSDFFLYYPEPSVVRNADEAYHKVFNFARKTKKGQRDAIMGAGIKVPDSYESTRAVLRPLRHMAGAGFQVVPTGTAYNASLQYASPLFEKQWEYRLIFSRGTHLLTLFKRVDPGTPSDVPWNHACGSTFVTTDNWNSCRLRHTSVLGDLQGCPIINIAHLVAVDVMLRKQPLGAWEYAVCEYNFCPSLSIERNLEKVVNHVR